MTEYYAGDIVTIYLDPECKKKVEGKAKLIQRIGSTEKWEYWQVQFTEPPYQTRWRVIIKE